MEYELVQKLASDLNVTRLALGQVICNHERGYSNYLSLPKIAKNWLKKTPQLSRKEWLAGTEALIYHCRVSPSSSGREAIALLSPPEIRYAENVDRYRGIYFRCGQNKNDETFGRGYEILKAEFGIHPVDEIGNNRVIEEPLHPKMHSATMGTVQMIQAKRPCGKRSWQW